MVAEPAAHAALHPVACTFHALQHVAENMTTLKRLFLMVLFAFLTASVPAQTQQPEKPADNGSTSAPSEELPADSAVSFPVDI